jgi:hypothetical protein
MGLAPTDVRGKRTQTEVKRIETSASRQAVVAGDTDVALSYSMPSPPIRTAESMLEEMGWVEYTVKYNKLVDYGIKLWKREYEKAP